MGKKPMNKQCNFCQKVFNRNYNLQSHINNKHLKVRLRCTICQENCFNLTGLKAHLRKGHNSNGLSLPECDYCGRVLSFHRNMVSHMQTVHKNPRDHRCPYCLKTIRSFPTNELLKAHLLEKHPNRNSYVVCNDCKKVFTTKKLLIAHITNNHSKDVTVCPVCSKQYTKYSNLKRHMESHYPKNVYKCEICVKDYQTKQSFNRHKKKRHPNLLAFKCDTCQQTFGEEPQLRKHVKESHDFDVFYKYCQDFLVKNTSNEKFKCDFCINSYPTVDELQLHMTIHKVDFLAIHCEFCYAKFFNRQSHAKHVLTCHPSIVDKIHKCSNCKKTFSNLSSLVFHTKVFHPDFIQSKEWVDLSAPFKCSLCDQSFYTDGVLNYHMNKKHAQLIGIKFTCEECGKDFADDSELQKHIESEHPKTPMFKCTFCPKQFKNWLSIRDHVNIVHQSNIHYCKECSQSFFNSNTMRKHIRVEHKKTVLYPKCPICYELFESPEACSNHIKTHTTKNQTCHLCQQTYSSFKLLRIHMETEHNYFNSCKHCDLVFTNEKSRIKHLKYHEEVHRCNKCFKVYETEKALYWHLEKFHKNEKVAEATNDLRKIIAENDLLNIPVNSQDGNVQEKSVLQTNVQNNSNMEVVEKECQECLQNFTDESTLALHNSMNENDSIVFSCNSCGMSYTVLEYALKKHKLDSERQIIDFSGQESELVLVKIEPL